MKKIVKQVARRIIRLYRQIWSFFQIILIRLHRVRIKAPAFIWGSLIISNRGQIEVGRNCYFRSSKSANLSGINSRIVLKALKGGALYIGENVGMSNCIIIAREKITIGAGTFIGADVKVFDSDFHSLYPEDRINGAERGIRTKPVFIGERCFIGSGAIILKGSKIGAESVIGAGSVVSGTVGRREIWAGNPARKIKDIPLRE